MTKISNNSTFQSLINDVNSLELIENILRMYATGLDLNIRELCQKSKEISTIADRFNEIFSEHGWIASEDMSNIFMEQAVKLFNESGIDKAEKFICTSFDSTYFTLHSQRMKAVWVWNENRSRLLNLAFTDHEQGRYHASIPVVLALIDGLSFDTNKASFFDKKSALTIKDGVAAHETGLRKLSNAISEQKSKTNINLLHFPYRHGILHGRELTYDNDIVSTKCFFILFALRPWALKCQQVEFDTQAGNPHEQIVGFKAGDLLAEKVNEILKNKFGN